MEAMGGSLCETEHLYVSTRMLLLAALDRMIELQQDLDREKRLHKIDIDHLRQLLDADVETDTDDADTESSSDHGPSLPADPAGVHAGPEAD